MKQTELIMGMPITVEIVDQNVTTYFKMLFDYFRDIDRQFSTYKSDSEISHINRGLPPSKWSKQVKTVLALCEKTKADTHGYFDIMRKGTIDPSGLVKGWAIAQAAHMLLSKDIHDFYIEAGGDVQTSGRNHEGGLWTVGIRNPFHMSEIIKTVAIGSEGVATSGTYIRGQHIYNPFQPDVPIEDIKSLTVIGPTIYEADRYATAAFAMGKKGIAFIESIPGLEGYLVDSSAVATYTTGFERYVING